MRLHRIICCGVALAALVLTAGLTTSDGAAAGGPPPVRERGGPGSWTKISTGSSATTLRSSLYRTSDGVLHVLYPKGAGTVDRLGHTAISPSGGIVRQNDVLSSWSTMDATPAIIGGPGGGLRAVFGGQRTTSAGFWSDGRMYTATAPASGGSWTLPMEAVGESHSAYGSYGTAATTLADGTPIAAFPLNTTITWHVGTGSDPDQSFDVAGCCVYNMAMVRDGSKVWIGWYANGGSSSTNGTFVRRIYPTLGPILKAPSSSAGASSLATGRVALAARTGGGVYAAYCVGYPDCNNIGLWKVGTTRVTKLPSSKYAAQIALSPGSSGRIWLAWADNIPQVKSVRTSKNGARFGVIRTAGMPHGTDAVYDIAVNGTTGRGDIVIQVGNGFWHTQVVAGLTVKGQPGSWRHGKKQKVTFAVTDAGDPVAGAKVAVGARHCTTAASGKCAITFPKSTRTGKLTVKATRTDYASGKATLRVK